jgi:hypothetical protein
MSLESIKSGGGALLGRLLDGGLTADNGLLAGLGVTAAAIGFGTAYLLVLRRPSYASFNLQASFPTVPPNVLFDFLVEPTNYYDPRINRKGYKPVILEREPGKITYQLEDDALGGLLHFSTPVVRRFYEHPDGREGSSYAASLLYSYPPPWPLLTRVCRAEATRASDTPAHEC